MARIRSLHPGQWVDEDFVSCSYPTRLLGLALRSMADDQGVFEWKPVQIKMQALPADTIEVGPLLEELQANNQVRRFEQEGRPYGAIRNFRKWQRPEKPKVLHPLPDNLRSYVGLAGRIGDASSSDGGGGRAKSSTAALPDHPQLTTGRRPIVDKSSNCSAEVGGNKKERDIFSSTPRNPQRSSAPPEAEFDAFWRAYPRRVGKEDARRAFAKARKTVELPALLAAIGQQQWNPDPQFIPYPATWLNGGHWQNEASPAANSSREPGQSYSGCL